MWKNPKCPRCGSRDTEDETCDLPTDVSSGIHAFAELFARRVRREARGTDGEGDGALNWRVQKAVEGPYYKRGKAPPSIDPGLYSSHADAERVVGVVGIRNAQMAYFRGETKFIGDS